MTKSFRKIRKEDVPATSTANIPADTVVVKKKKKKKKKTVSLDTLLVIPEEEIEEDNQLSTIRELELSMKSNREINSMKDLRPDDYKGVSINISRLFNMIKKRKG
tara:strand:- start:797 stop:1111 length:315 start_codon:yes stop_codon:yes gene_type:complete